MLLNEIIDIDRVRQIKRFASGGGLKPIGDGVFAMVFDGKRPGTVIKIATVDSPNDAYVQFIRLIQKNQDNVFFPRIYHAKLFQPDTGFVDEDIYQFVVEMEKLLPLTDRRLRDALPYIIDSLKLDFTGMPSPFETEDEHRFTVRLNSLLREAFSSSRARRFLRDASDNPEFIQALDALEFLFQKESPDMHGGNAMIRLTSTGPQLVITDPVVDRGAGTWGS